MKKNEATWDRIARIVVGAVLIVAGFGFIDGALGTFLGAFGFVPLATGLIGWCPLYALFGISTCPVDRVAERDRVPSMVD